MRYEALESSKEKDVVDTTDPGGGGDWVRMAAPSKLGGVSMVPVDKAMDSVEAVVSPGGDGLTSVGAVTPVVGAAVVSAAIGSRASKSSGSSAIVAANKSSKKVPEASSSPSLVGGW